MAHRFYHTEGFILSSRPYGEHGKVFKIYTKDFGLITASIPGVRKLDSKLRLVLQDLAWVKLSVVRGREYWRLPAVEQLLIWPIIKKQRQKFLVYAQMLKFVRQLIQGEEADAGLYDILNKAVCYLADKQKFSSADAKNWELLVAMRLLHQLGHLSDRSDYRLYLQGDDWSDDLLENLSAIRQRAITEINHRLRELTI